MNPIPIPDAHHELREALRGLCRQFDSAYWQKVDTERGYPEAFVDALAEAGWLAALIPQDYGGSGLGLAEASVIMEEINLSGGNAGACHGQMYNMGTLLRHGSVEQKQRYLPGIASGEIRLQAFGVTEPTSGSDTSKLQTKAVREGDQFFLTGQKVWTSRALQSDLMLVLARTTPVQDGQKKTDGLSVFLLDITKARQNGLEIRKLET